MAYCLSRCIINTSIVNIRLIQAYELFNIVDRVGNCHLGSVVYSAGNRSRGFCQRHAGGFSFGIAQCFHQAHPHNSDIADKHPDAGTFYFSYKRLAGHIGRFGSSRICSFELLVGADFQRCAVASHLLDYKESLGRFLLLKQANRTGLMCS